MATDLEKLVVQLSADIKGYQRGMEKAVGVTNRQARAIEARWRQANKNLDGIGRGMAQSLIAPLAGIGAAIGTREILSYADAWTRAGNLVAAAAQVAGRSGRSLEGINQIAQDTRSGFSETAELYARILRSTAGVAESESDVAKATEIVNKAFKAGGAGASEMAAGILQLSQGLSSGVLQGDELRSVRENAPLLAQAIADYFGVTLAGMKKLGEEGKLTSDKVFKAILASKSKIDGAFNATSQTIEDAVTRVNNAFTQYIGQSDQGLGASGRLTAGLNALADNFDRVADVTLKVASIIAAALVGRSIAGMIAKLGIATNAVTAFVAALRTASIATAIGGIGAAAGPLGLLIGGTVAAALALYYSRTQDATVGSKEYAAALKQVEDAAKKTGPAVEDAAKKAAQATEAAYAGAAAKAKQAMAEMADDATRQIDNALEIHGRANPAADAQVAQIRKLYEEYKNGRASADDLKRALDNLSSSQAPAFFIQLANALKQMLPQLERAADVSRSVNLAKMEKDFAPFQAEAQYDETQRKIAKAAKDYIADATRRSKLTKDQLALEEEIARVKKDASGKSVQLTDAQAKEAAKVNLAGNDRRSAEGKKVARTADSRFDQDIQSVKDRTAALIEEQKIVGLDTEKQEARRLALDLQQSALKRLREEARQKGVTDLDSIKLSDEQRAKIEAVAAAYGKQYAELEKLNGPLATFARQSADVGKALDASLASSLDRFSDDLADVVLKTKSVADAIKSMTDLILKEFIKIALKKAILGPIAGLFSGGVGSIGKVIGFDEGGPTPAGPKAKAVGIVHAGENVWSQEDVRRAGGMHVVEAMRRGARGYAVGGPVAAPSIPRIAPTAAAAQKSTINIVDNVGVKVQAREVVDGRGNRRVDVQLDEAVAASLSRPGSASRGALRNNFGARPVGVRR